LVVCSCFDVFGVSVWLGWGGIRVAGFSLLHGYGYGHCITNVVVAGS
jgi:hypothetical protein